MSQSAKEALLQVAANIRPTKFWQYLQVSDFAEIVAYVKRMRNHEARLDEKDEEFEIQPDTDISWWDRNLKAHPPKLSIVLDFTSEEVEEALTNLFELIKLTKPGNTVDYHIGQWMYGMLACLRTPLDTDIISLLRGIARESWKIRSRIDPTRHDALKKVAPLNLIICLVGQYYKQLDLADSME